MIPELRTLIAVARHGTFAAAGERIGLTQAAVSGQVRRLEEHLGFVLFDRTGRSARLNADGLRTLARAEAIVAAFGALGDPAQDEAWAQPLRLGAIASVQATILARALTPFRLRFPRCRVHLAPGVSLQLVDRVDAGELDAALLIRPGFDLPRDLEWTPLVREDYVLIAGAAVGGDDWRRVLHDHPLIRYDRASFGGRQVDRFLRGQAVMVREWLEIDDIQAMVSMVGRGLGVAVVPLTETILPLPDAVHVIPLGRDPIRREIGVAHRRDDGRDVLTGLIECLQGAGAPPPP